MLKTHPLPEYIVTASDIAKLCTETYGGDGWFEKVFSGCTLGSCLDACATPAPGWNGDPTDDEYGDYSPWVNVLNDLCSKGLCNPGAYLVRVVMW